MCQKGAPDIRTMPTDGLLGLAKLGKLPVRAGTTAGTLDLRSAQPSSDYR